MAGVYDDVLEGVAQQLADVMWSREGLRANDALDVDGAVRRVIFQLGLLVCSLLYSRLARDAVEAAKSRGLTINRSREILVTCLFGVVQVCSPYLRNRQTGDSERPVAARLGLSHLCRTTAVQRAMTDFGVETAFELAADRFEEHYGHRPGRTSMLRVVEDTASAAEEYVARRLAGSPPPLKSRKPWAILLELDGCEIRAGELDRPEKGEATKLTPVRELVAGTRPVGYRDVRLGFARGINAEKSSRIWVGGLEDYDALAERLHRAAVHCGLEPGVMVVAVVDGGNGIREALERRFKGLIVVLDRPHLKSHLHATAAVMPFDDDEQRKAWVELMLMRFGDGDAELVLDVLEGYEGAGAERVAQLTKHLRRFHDAIHYGLYKHVGIPIGSGEGESGHKSVVQPRMKRPGAVWHPETITPMVALRVVRANGWWDDFWRARGEALRPKAAAA